MPQSKGITIVGLGPGDPGLITRQAWDWLNSVEEVYLRTSRHPAVAALPLHVRKQSFDAVFEEDADASAQYTQVVESVLDAGRRPQGATYAVPGHPFVAEETVPEIVRRARAENLPVKVMEGVSFIEPACSALGIDLFPQASLIDALALARLHTPSFPPSAPALIAHMASRPLAVQVKNTLLTVYPAQFTIRLVYALGSGAPQTVDMPLVDLDSFGKFGSDCVLFVPTLGEGASLEAFQEIVAHLRAEDGCPWDKEQTHHTLRTHLLGETYETLQAMDDNDPAGMAEEFGDLLLQIVLNAQIGVEEREFNMADILNGISSKIIRRHPHVFGNVEVDGVSGVLQNWEKLKAAERAAKGDEKKKGLLDGVPLIFPSLAQAQEIQDRAARVGFDWDDIEKVWQKVPEEMEEVRCAETPEDREKELGDLLFAVVNVVRWYKVDAEAALRTTNLRFRKRFAHLEKRSRETGRSLMTMTLDEMDEWWREAKQLEHQEDV